MKVSAVVCHHKGRLVLKAIRSILASKQVEVELIVVTSQEKSSFHGARTLYLQGGPASKRNLSLRFSSSDYIAFFDDDVEVTPTCLIEMLIVLQQDEVGMVFGKTLNMEFKNRFDEAGSFLTSTGFLWSRGDRVKDTGQFEKIEPILAGKSASCMIKRKAFSQAGLFDESYEILGEETDLAWRVWLMGWKVLYVPKSIAYHAFNTRFKPFDYYSHSRVYFNGCRNYLAMLTTNLGFTRLLLALPIQLTAWTLCGLGMVFRGKFKAGYHIFRGLFYYFSNLGNHLAKRKKVQKARIIKESQLMAFVLRNPSLTYYLKRFLRYLSTGLHG